MESSFNIKNLKSCKKVMEPFFRIKNFKSRKKVMESFLSIINFIVRRKWRSPFFNIKDFKSRKVAMGFFLSFRNFKSRKKVTHSFFSDHALISFHMMHEFPGAIFLCRLPLNFFGYTFLCLTKHFFDCISLTIHFNLHEERCRAHFSKYCNTYFPTTQINGLAYVMSGSAIRSFPSNSCSEDFQKYLRKSPYVSNDCEWKLYL